MTDKLDPSFRWDDTLKAIPRHLAIIAIQFVSAFFRALGWRGCRFAPSCSRYAVEAFGALPFFKALGLSLRRVSHCHPFSAGGHDPLPIIKEA